MTGSRWRRSCVVAALGALLAVAIVLGARSQSWRAERQHIVWYVTKYQAPARFMVKSDDAGEWTDVRPLVAGIDWSRELTVEAQPSLRSAIADGNGAWLRGGGIWGTLGGRSSLPADGSGLLRVRALLDSGGGATTATNEVVVQLVPNEGSSVVLNAEGLLELGSVDAVLWDLPVSIHPVPRAP